MPDDCQNALSTIVSGGLRAIAASFPGFASIGQAWSEYEDYITSKRITELMENLRTKVEQLNGVVSDFEERCQQIHEEFPSLLEITVEKVRREFSEEKRKLYADVLANVSFRQYQEAYDDKVSVLHSLDLLTTQDIEVLGLFRHRDEAAAKDLEWHDLDLQGDDNHKLAELASLLARLESRGLIVTVGLHSGVVFVRDGLDPAVARLAETVYRVLPMGRRVLSALD